jgi:hypothetical protein
MFGKIVRLAQPPKNLGVSHNLVTLDRDTAPFIKSRQMTSLKLKDIVTVPCNPISGA